MSRRSSYFSRSPFILLSSVHSESLLRSRLRVSVTSWVPLRSRPAHHRHGGPHIQGGSAGRVLLPSWWEMVSRAHLLQLDASCYTKTTGCGSCDGVIGHSANNMLITTGTCARPARSLSGAAWQIRVQMDVTATVCVRLVDRRLLTVSLQEDRAVDRRLSGPASKHRHSGKTNF